MSTQGQIPPSRSALSEALNLSTELLRNMELSEIPLANVALKASRLARLLNDFDYQKIMEYEASGYPNNPDGVSSNVWKLGKIADRIRKEEDKDKKVTEMMYMDSINQMEEIIKVSATSLSAAQDSNGGRDNSGERSGIRQLISLVSNRLASRRSMIYQYVVRQHYELKFSGIADDIFTRTRQRVDAQIGLLVPDTVKKLSAVYDGLSSENPESWSNAVHSCRRILQDLADTIFPATDQDRIVETNGKPRPIKLGKDQYINRLVAYIEDNSSSERFQEIVGSHLGYIGDRLDSVFRASQKGSHDNIVSREEADRYVIFTYLLVGDILSLKALDISKTDD